MKKLLLLLLTILMGMAPLTLSAQNTLTVADGTETNSNVPIHGVWADYYMRCQTIYTAGILDAAATDYSMIGGTITSLTYYLSSPADDVWTGTWEIKLMEVSDATLTGFVDMTNATTVYTGVLNGTSSPLTIPFSTPYTYQGGNLLIEVSKAASSNYSSCTFYGVSATGASWQGRSSLSLASIDGSVQDFIPKTTFTFTSGSEITCLPVQNLTVDASQTTSNSLTLIWSDAFNSGATYSVYDMSDNTLIESDITDTTYTVENLNANTIYTFGVEANCSATDVSAKMTTSNRTACGAVTMPWSENFDNWTSKSDCWAFLSGAYNGGNGTPSEYSYAWTLNNSYGSYITISGKALTMNLYSTLQYWAVTPAINITDDNAMLSVDVAVSAWSSATPNYDDNDTLAFAISTDNGNTFTNLRVLNNTELNSLNGEYTTLYVPVTGYDGQTVRFAIYGGSISGTSPYDNRIAIDNVTVGEPISCLPVTGLSVSDITSTGATLTWEGDADGYTIYNMSDTTVDQYATDITAELYALEPNTSYTFGVTANCGSDESSFRTVSFTTLVSCPAPTNLVATLTPGDGTVASLSWNNNGTEAWQICLNGDTNDLIDVTTNPYELTGLTPETAITAQIRAICDVDEQSAWSNTITFTPTNAYMITVNDGTETNGYVPVYGYWTDNITKSQFIIPASDLAAMQLGTINKLTFYASEGSVSWGAATFNVYLTTTNNTTLTELADYSNMTQVYSGSLSISDNKMEVTFTTPYLYTGANLMVGFLQTLEGTYSSCSWYGVSATDASMGGYGTSINQQDFLPKTTIHFTPSEGDVCYPVTGLTVDSVTANSVFLSWNDNNNMGATYTIYDMSDSSVVVSGLYDLEYEVTGLTGSTRYTFGVAANCSTSEESFIHTVNATTDCENESCQISIVGNDSYGDGWNGNAIQIIQGGTVIGTFTFTNGYTSTETFSVCSGAPVSFSWTIGSYASETSFEIRNADNYPLYIVEDGSGLTAGVFLTMNNACTSCIPVSALNVDAITSNSVTISWSGSADSYDVYNGETLVDNTFDTTYTFDNLASSSNYAFGVVANCSDGESAMMVTVTASTQCGIIDVFPYVQDFSTEPACWTTIDADGDGYTWDIPIGYTAIQSASWISGVGALTPDNWLVSPQFAIPSTGNYEVTWTATAQDQSFPAEHYGVFISTTGYENTDDYTMIHEWTLGTGVFNPVIDLSAYSGQNIYIALRHFNCTDQFRLSIDEFTVREQAGANQVTINVGQNNPAYGTVTGSGIYDIGDDVTVSATANSGYVFSRWVDETNDTLSTDNPYTFVAATDLTLKAIFIDSYGTSYTITVQVNDSTMGTAIGGGTYTSGEQITLVATPFSGYNFVNWTQVSSYGTNVVGTDPSIIITVTSDKTFVANFESGSGPVITDPTVATNAATAIAQTTATLNATITNPDNVTVTAKGFEWKTTTGGTYTQIAGTGTGNTFTANLTGLTANTGYTFKAFITFNGTTVYGNEMTFNTLPEDVEPCNAPTGLTAGDITGESIAISWDANANAEGYNIQYSPQGGTISTASSTTNSYTITGLAQNTTYQIQVQANCGNDNLSGWSQSITVQTTGINNHLSNSISLYPNPAKEYVDVRIDGDANVTAMEVYDVYGKLINTVNVVDNPTRINVSGLANGMYFVRVTTEAGTVTKTFVKK